MTPTTSPPAVPAVGPPAARNRTADLPGIDSPEWAALNRRRAELIGQSSRGLTAAEAAELARLNAVADAIHEPLLPPLPFTPEQRALIERVAGGR